MIKQNINVYIYAISKFIIANILLSKFERIGMENLKLKFCEKEWDFLVILLLYGEIEIWLKN